MQEHNYEHVGLSNQLRTLSSSLLTPVQHLLAPSLRRSTLLLLVLWFISIFAIYGIVLLTTTVRPRALMHVCMGQHVHVQVQAQNVGVHVQQFASCIHLNGFTAADDT